MSRAWGKEIFSQKSHRFKKGRKGFLTGNDSVSRALKKLSQRVVSNSVKKKGKGRGLLSQFELFGGGVGGSDRGGRSFYLLRKVNATESGGDTLNISCWMNLPGREVSEAAMGHGPK